MKLFYNLWYRHGTPPWVSGPRPELVDLVTNGVLPPGRAIDLGCGVGDNAIFLAQHGFTVTGIETGRIADGQAVDRGVGCGTGRHHRLL